MVGKSQNYIKNNSFFYQEDRKNKRIFLLTFFDNRQNPESLKFDSMV